MSTDTQSRQYYDQFSTSYEAHRHRPYHRMLDDLEVEIVRRYARRRVLEAGCGTGLILDRLSQDFEATGLDLSAGMLEHAQARGLNVSQGSVSALPYPDGYFDTVCSFKVLAHVPEIEQTLAELVRVTSPGGHLLLEFYNRISSRFLVKALKQPTRIANAYTDDDVFTRYDTLASIRSYLPPNVKLVTTRGIRIATPVAQAHELPWVGPLFNRFDRWAADAPVLRNLGGFLIVVLQRD